jgi:integrase
MESQQIAAARPPKQAPRKVRLTELSIRKCKAGPVTATLWDTLARGLALRVAPTGAKSWYYVYSRQGRPRWLRLGNAGPGGIRLAEARKLATEHMLAVARGGDPAAERCAQRTAGTLGEYIERYFAEHARKHNRSWRQADALLRRHVLPRFGKLAASAIARRDIKAMVAGIDKASVATQTVRFLSPVFEWCIREDLLTTNPCRGIAKNVTVDRERILAASEVAPFWHALDDIDRVRALALRMILVTGQRPGEVTHMRWEHVRDGWWGMPGKPDPVLGWPGTKNGKSHRVWLPEPACAILEEISDGEEITGGYVFANDRGGTAYKLDGAMRELSARLKMDPPVRPHDLRRTHGSTITALGFGRDAMNRIQNHIEGGIADVYDQHKYADENKRIMEVVASRITASVEGKATNVLQFSR